MTDSDIQNVLVLRKGVALVETEKGILLVSENGRVFSLPGGRAIPGETREETCKRELKEKTNLSARSAFYFHSYKGRIWHDRYNQPVRNHAKVFIVDAEGEARPQNRIKKLAWWNPGSSLKLSTITESLIHRYLKLYSKEPS